MNESKTATRPREAPSAGQRPGLSAVGLYSAREFLDDQRDVLATTLGAPPALPDTLDMFDGRMCRVDFTALLQSRVRTVTTLRFDQRYGAHSALHRDAYLQVLRFLDDHRADVIRSGLAVGEGPRLAVREEFLDHVAKAAGDAGDAGDELVSGRVITEFLSAWGHRWM